MGELSGRVWVFLSLITTDNVVISGSLMEAISYKFN